MSTVSPFTFILCFLGLAIALVDQTFWIAWGAFLLAFINEAMVVWATYASRPPREEERFEG
jgi:Flp pilus assembly protein TadB